MTNMWELCFVRPKVRQGPEVVFLRPHPAKNVIFRNLEDYLKHHNCKPSGNASDSLALAVSLILRDGWEPISIGGGIGEWSGAYNDLGATGYGFRRPYTTE